MNSGQRPLTMHGEMGYSGRAANYTAAHTHHPYLNPTRQDCPKTTVAAWMLKACVGDRDRMRRIQRKGSRFIYP